MPTLAMLDGQAVPELSIVILCYKTGQAVRPLVASLIKLLHEAKIFDFELVLIGNYVENSDDPTPAVVKALASEFSFIKAIVRPKQGWMGWDMRSGLEAARGHYIAVTDGDGQMPMSDIIRVYRDIKKYNYDLVKTYRVTRGDGIKRRCFSACYNLLYRLLFPNFKIKDVNSKPKILTRNAYDQLVLQDNGWTIDAEIMIQARRLNLKIAELPTEFLGLVGRRSFISLGPVLEFIKNLIIYRIREFKARKES